MFDFSKEIELGKKDYSFYQKIRIILYLSAFLAMAYLSYLVVFPHKYFSFSFLIDANSPKNNMSEPYLAESNVSSPGKLSSGEKLFFDASVPNGYTSVKVRFKLKEKTTSIFLPIEVRKSYKAFTYKTGQPLGFKDGSLLENKNDSFIVSNGQLKKFSSARIIEGLGYQKNSFLKISEDDLKYNPRGEDILAGSPYPDATLFHIDDTYYFLRNQKLEKFISDQAFFLQYEESQAIEKNSEFLEKYPLSENWVGFPNGTLVSNRDSVNVISQNIFFPIDSPETFLSKGFAWENVVPAGDDEMSFYEKGYLFNFKKTHLDGTIFKEIEESNYFLIKGEEKIPLPTENIARSWSKKNPVLASKKGFETKLACNSEKSFFNPKISECEIPLKNLESFPGFSYQFNITSDQDIDIDLIDVDYKKTVSWKNFKDFGKTIISQIILNYVQK